MEPDLQGLLDVGDGNLVFWEAGGNPHGKPALIVHGGPGSPSDGLTRYFDPERYRVVNFHQRGCGKSRPSALDPATDMRPNTTEHLIADMELLRERLGIETWLLLGGSWGSTLILAYAERFPHRVSEIVLIGVTTSRPAEGEWLYQGVGRFLPAEWENFRDGVPPADRTDLHAILAGYATLMNDPDPEVRLRAATTWVTWEDAVIGHETNGRPDSYSDQPPDELLTMVRICAHYFSNNVFLDGDIVLREAHKLAGIPAVLIHGRLDLSSPLDTAWQLTKVWPEADLVVIDDSGHTGSPAMSEAIRAALERFSRA